MRCLYSGVNCYCLLNHFIAFFECKHECCMFTVTLQPIVVKEIMETFAFKVKILENQASISMYSSASYLRDVFGNHLLSKLITTSKMDSVIINFNCAIAYYRKFELLVARVVNSEDFLGFRLRLLTPTPAVLKNRLRLQHF